MSAADFGAQGQVAAIKARGCAAAGVIRSRECLLACRRTASNAPA